MSMLRLVWRNMVHRRLLTVLTVLSIALTSALIVFLLLVANGVENGAEKGYGPFDLVIGADGSETQLALNTFYHVGAPTGNVPYSIYEAAAKDLQAESVFAITTGDSYNGYPIVGVEPGYFAVRYGDRRLELGKLYGVTGEAVIGAYVAKATGLKVGDTFRGAHGLTAEHGAHGSAEVHEGEEHGEHHETDEHAESGEHNESGQSHETDERVESGEHNESGQSHETGERVESDAHNESSQRHETGEQRDTEGYHESGNYIQANEHSEASDRETKDSHQEFIYRVTGILPVLHSPDDRAVFTTVDYAWAVHHTEAALHKEVTAVMVKPKSLPGAQGMKRAFDAMDNVQAIYTSKAVADVLNMVDKGTQAAGAITALCIALAAITLTLSLIAAASERKRDVGLLRLIGKSRAYVCVSLLAEGLLLTAAGLALGLVLGHVGSHFGSAALFGYAGIQLQAWSPAPGEGLLAAGALLIGAAASLAPALGMYRVDPLQLFRG